MSEFTKDVVGVRFETTERELSSKTTAYKNGGSTILKTIEIRTKVMIDLSCGHSREQQNGTKDMTKSKRLDCWKCQSLARIGAGL